jgi:hypothetical protein
MKIFISHSSKNKNYGEALVDLLTGVGIGADQIIFTSNDAYGIPTGENIFDWLKNRIIERPHVLYLLSPEYYSSVACLNEMGAAWVVENAHTMVFTPDFKLDSYEFQNGVLDPREIGFFINNEDRLISFIDSLKATYGISVNSVVIHQKIRTFLKCVNSIEAPVMKSVSKPVVRTMPTILFESNRPSTYDHEMAKLVMKNYGKTRFTFDLINNKLEDYEVLLAYYVIDNGRFKLRTGWQLGHEIEDIKAWEDVNELKSVLSLNFEKALKRFQMRKLVEVSDVTSSGNPKEFVLIEAFQEELLNQSKEVEQLIRVVIDRNRHDEQLPF